MMFWDSRISCEWKVLINVSDSIDGASGVRSEEWEGEVGRRGWVWAYFGRDGDGR